MAVQLSFCISHTAEALKSRYAWGIMQIYGFVEAQAMRLCI
jgi:hypothetical protein